SDFDSSVKLRNLGFNPDIEITNENDVDETPPELVSLAFSTRNIDVTEALQTFTVTYVVREESEISNFTLWFKSNGGSGTIYWNPTGYSDWVEGDEPDTYVRTATFEADMNKIAGTWSVLSALSVTDSIGNRTSDFDSSVKLRNLGFNPDIAINSDNENDASITSQSINNELFSSTVNIQPSIEYEFIVLSKAESLSDYNFSNNGALSSNCSLIQTSNQSSLKCSLSSSTDTLSFNINREVGQSNSQLMLGIFPKSGTDSDYSNNVIYPTSVNQDNDQINDFFDVDWDNDGLSNAEEQTVGLDILSVDSDGDGIVDSDETVVFELISSFPNLHLKIHALDEDINLSSSYIRLANGFCLQETSFDSVSEDLAEINILLPEDIISGDYIITVQSADVPEEYSFSLINPNADNSVPNLTDFVIDSDINTNEVFVKTTLTGVENPGSGNSLKDNEDHANHTLWVASNTGDPLYDYVGSIPQKIDFNDTSVNYETIFIVDGIEHILAPKIKYFKFCESSFNGVEATIDSDADGAIDTFDFEPSDSSGWVDIDWDELDNSVDNCQLTFNQEQTDLDEDGRGDVCDSDIDGDGILNELDAFPRNAMDSIDSDNDGLGDNLESSLSLDVNQVDSDFDGLLDAFEVANELDLIGDDKIVDSDNDGVANYLSIFNDIDNSFVQLPVTLKIIIVDSTGANNFNFAPVNQNISVSGQSFLISGSDKIDRFFIDPYNNYDLTNTKGSKDQIIFPSGYLEKALLVTVSPETGVMQLLNRDGKVHFLSSNVASDELVFIDGTISSDTIKNRLLAEQPLYDLTLGAPVFDKASNTGAVLKMIALDRNGQVFFGQGPNIQVVLSGSEGIDSVLVTPGSIVDSSNLKGSQDKIFLTGAWSDYDKSLDISGNIIFTRVYIDDGISFEEIVIVSNGANVATNDLVIFSDGHAETTYISEALKRDLNAKRWEVKGFDKSIYTK
ncbi:thrombospondin type 3 repeat-containing protein, partial [Opacimonas viscosa]